MYEKDYLDVKRRIPTVDNLENPAKYSVSSDLILLVLTLSCYIFLGGEADVKCTPHEKYYQVSQTKLRYKP